MNTILFKMYQEKLNYDNSKMAEVINCDVKRVDKFLNGRARPSREEQYLIYAELRRVFGNDFYYF